MDDKRLLGKDICLKRIYEPYDESDGIRILVDRLWPRGISKEEAKLVYWLKDAAPSTVLRKEFNHKPEKFTEFRTQYLAELQTEGPSDAVDTILHLADKDRVTLLYGAKDSVHNHAKVLLEELIRRIIEKST